jgi:hypothetical protein
VNRVAPSARPSSLSTWVTEGEISTGMPSSFLVLINSASFNLVFWFKPLYQVDCMWLLSV